MNQTSEPRHEDYLRHIVEAAERVARYTAGMDRQAFENDEKTKDAVIRNLEIIGEAAGRLVEKYPDFTAKHASIPWRNIYGMRNRLSHGYFEVNLTIVWDTAKTSLPELEKQIRNLLLL